MFTSLRGGHPRRCSSRRSSHLRNPFFRLPCDLCASCCNARCVHECGATRGVRARHSDSLLSVTGLAELEHRDDTDADECCDGDENDCHVIGEEHC